MRLRFDIFRKNKLGSLSLLYIVCIGLIAVFCYQIAPDNTENANFMHLEIHSKSPGFECYILDYDSPNGKQEYAVSRFEETESGTYFTPYGITDWDLNKFIPSEQNPKVENRKFLFGTDKFGRDLLSRILIGSRISFFIGIIAVLVSLLIGISLGAIAGYYGGKVDQFIMWIINITWSIPTLLLVIAITLALGKGYWQVFIAVGVSMWVEIARVVRGQIISLKNEQYVEAARVLGYSDFRINRYHILPNIIAPIIVISSANFAAAILIESGLSFLGIGAQPPTPSWGGIIKDHYNYLLMGKPYLAIIPGLAILSLVMAFMLFGNAVRDILDVKN